MMLLQSTVPEKRNSPLINACLCFAFVVAITLVAIMPLRARADVSTPDTPAGRTLRAFLDAFNSGEHDRIAAYVKEYDPENSADGLTSFSSQTGGFTLVSIVHSAPDKLSFLVHGHGDNIEAYGALQLASTTPPRVKRISIRAIPPGAKVDDIQLDEATRQKTIDAISEALTEYYVYPDVAAKMIQAIRDHQKHGNYNSIVDGNEFADALSRDLRDVSQDKHLFVGYDPYILPTQSAPSDEPRQPSPADEARFRAMLEHDNCTFSKVEILNHNIGYIKFGAFPDPNICGPTVVAAMNFVAHTDALIFDLRENHGGDPSMVEFMVSYLFREPTHINDLTNRHDNETHQYWTLPWIPGPRFIDQPVYVLTSHETFSGGEEFTFDLKTQKRGTIVGETTGGGAHPVRGMPAGDHFTIGVPFGRPINPVTKGDWEGKGVEPDVKVSAVDALITAEKLAAEKLGTKDSQH
jgi:Peptidase family S41/N-terminal domain of Peptidase_S41 in eukaryotic IRBP